MSFVQARRSNRLAEIGWRSSCRISVRGNRTGMSGVWAAAAGSASRFCSRSIQFKIRSSAPTPGAFSRSPRQAESRARRCSIALVATAAAARSQDFRWLAAFRSAQDRLTTKSTSPCRPVAVTSPRTTVPSFKVTRSAGVAARSSTPIPIAIIIVAPSGSEGTTVTQVVPSSGETA